MQVIDIVEHRRSPWSKRDCLRVHSVGLGHGRRRRVFDNGRYRVLELEMMMV